MTFSKSVFQDVTRVLAGPSGFVLTPVVLSGNIIQCLICDSFIQGTVKIYVKKIDSFVLPDSSVHTNAVVLVNIDFKDSLQTMLEGSYRSGGRLFYYLLYTITINIIFS